MTGKKSEFIVVDGISGDFECGCNRRLAAQRILSCRSEWVRAVQKISECPSSPLFQQWLLKLCNCWRESVLITLEGGGFVPMSLVRAYLLNPLCKAVKNVKAFNQRLMKVGNCSISVSGMRKIVNETILC